MNLSFQGKPAAGEISNVHTFTAAGSLASGLVGSDVPRAVANTPPADAAAQFTLYKWTAGASVSVGTVTLAKTTGAPTFSGSASFLAGDAAYAEAPATQDSAMSDVSLQFSPE